MLNTLFMKTHIKGIFGYDSFHDLLFSFFKLKSMDVNALFALCATATSFITKYVWDSAEAVNTLFFLIFMDWVTGTYLAARATYYVKCKKNILTQEQREFYQKRMFRSHRFFRIFATLPLAFTLLALSFWLSKSFQPFYILPGMFYGGFAGGYLMSLYENLTEMGYFSKDFLIMLKSKLKFTQSNSDNKSN
jgi:hypothetical protein